MNAFTRRDLLKGAAVGAGALLLDASLVQRALALVAPVASIGTVTNNSIRVNWTDAGDENSYYVQESPNGVSGWNVGQFVAKNVLTFNFTGLTPGSTHFYRVKAAKGQNFTLSNVVSATTTGGGSTNATVGATKVGAVAVVPGPVVQGGGGGTWPSYGSGY